jgi:hypothetical protein
LNRTHMQKQASKKRDNKNSVCAENPEVNQVSS